MWQSVPLESARAMSQDNHNSHPKERNDGRPGTEPVEPDGASSDLCLWTWLGRPRTWSVAQTLAMAMLVCFAGALFMVFVLPADFGVPMAWGLATMANLLLVFVLILEVVRSFRRE